MRRIRIDNFLETKVNNFCDTLFTKRKFELPKEQLIKLKEGFNIVFKRSERRYVQHILDNYNRILRSKPSEFNLLISEFDSIISNNKISKRLHDGVLKALRYEDLREIEYLDIIKEIGINTCVYCNAQLTVVIDLKKITRGTRKNDFDRKGNLEIDHYFPTSKYPFLSTSFFNLIPCCSNCNKAKSNKTSNFYLYSEDDNLDAFIFSIDPDSLDVFRASKKPSDIKIKFESTNADSSLLQNHKELFRIDEIYATQKDIAEEIIHKADAYTNAYKQSLVTSFEQLFPDKAIINRLLVGNYDKPSEIHKRPMSKFTQDIARQLKLLK